MAFAVEELKELVVDLGPQELAQERFGLEVVRPPRRDARVGQRLGHRQQRGVQILEQTPAKRGVAQHAGDRQDREQDGAVAEREARPDREGTELQGHASRPSMYPAPRTVWSSRRSPSPSIFLRR